MSEAPSTAPLNLVQGQPGIQREQEPQAGLGVQERTENLVSHVNSVSSSVTRNVTCLSFLISETGRLILDSSLSQRNNNNINRHLGTEKN